MRHLIIPVAIISLCIVASGCWESKGPAEKTGETIDKAGEKTGEVLKDGAQKTGEAAKDLKDDVKDKVNDGK